MPVNQFHKALTPGHLCLPLQRIPTYEPLWRSQPPPVVFSVSFYRGGNWGTDRSKNLAQGLTFSKWAGWDWNPTRVAHRPGTELWFNSSLSKGNRWPVMGALCSAGREAPSVPGRLTAGLNTRQCFWDPGWEAGNSQSAPTMKWNSEARVSECLFHAFWQGLPGGGSACCPVGLYSRKDTGLLNLSPF